jgi:hypothetical protein
MWIRQKKYVLKGKPTHIFYYQKINFFWGSNWLRNYTKRKIKTCVVVGIFRLRNTNENELFASKYFHSISVWLSSNYNVCVLSHSNALWWDARTHSKEKLSCGWWRAIFIFCYTNFIFLFSRTQIWKVSKATESHTFTPMSLYTSWAAIKIVLFCVWFQGYFYVHSHQSISHIFFSHSV